MIGAQQKKYDDCYGVRTEEPRRLLLVCTRNMSPGGGEQRLNDRTARAIWLATGILTDLVNLTRSSRVDQAASYVRQCPWYGDSVFLGWWPATLASSLLRFEWTVQAMLDRHPSTQVMILSGGMPPWAARQLIRLARTRRVRLIYNSHGTLSELTEYPHGRNPVVRCLFAVIAWLLRKGEAKAYVESDAITVVSAELADSLRADYGVPKGRPEFVIPCGTEAMAASDDPTWRLQTREEWRSRLGFDAAETVFVYSGGGSAWQCVPETITLFEALVGQVEGKSRLCIFSQDPSITRLVADRAMRTSSSITIKALDASDVLGALTACDVGMMLRKRDRTNRVAFPNKFSEYVQAGCYVLLSDATPAPARVARRYSVGSVVEDSDPSEYLHVIDERRRNLGAFYVKCDTAVAEALDYGRNVKPLIEWVEHGS